MDAGRGSVFDGLGAGVDIARDGAREAGDARLAHG